MNIQVSETKIANRKTTKQAQELAALTRALSHCCLDKEERICRTFGLHSADGRVLAALLCENVATSSAIAARLGIGNSRVTPLIDRLAKKGLVSRTEAGQDRRVRKLELTDAGRSVATKLHDFETELHENLLSRFPTAKRKELLDTLIELRAAMDSVRSSIEL